MKMHGEVWKEYLEIRQEAEELETKATICMDNSEHDRAQAWATLAVAGRLECLCYILTNQDVK